MSAVGTEISYSNVLIKIKFCYKVKLGGFALPDKSLVRDRLKEHENVITTPSLKINRKF